ncbi:translation elongation factor Ts [Candidatus Peregrinibacteria bacterium]|nr:translation elongation factor Ts [Candidatus Peregrinibacteria bacterium]
MSPVSAQAIASLRARTGVSILACKEALEAAGGDEEKAIEILRKRGISQAAKKAARDQSEGLVFLKESGRVAALVMLRCETDFVARDSAFQAAGTALAETLLKDGQAAAEKIAGEKVPELVQKLGENITVGEMHRIEADIPGTYVHSNAKIGVIIGLTGGTAEQARDAAMHAAAMNPLYVAPEDVDASLVEKEKDIWREQLAKEGKPAAIMDKIMIGKEKKFREESSLLTQPFVKDNSMTVGKYLGSAKVTAYIRISIS